MKKQLVQTSALGIVEDDEIPMMIGKAEEGPAGMVFGLARVQSVVALDGEVLLALLVNTGDGEVRDLNLVVPAEDKFRVARLIGEEE